MKPKIIETPKLLPSVNIIFFFMMIDLVDLKKAAHPGIRSYSDSSDVVQDNTQNYTKLTSKVDNHIN